MDLSSLKRAIRLVVDTGMHDLEWSREEAAKYMADNSATTIEGARSDMDRYSIWPGQATAYMVGLKRLLAMRERAVQALGPRFDLKGFHSIIIDDGAFPLDMLDQRVDSWISAMQVGPVQGGQ